MRLLSKSKLLAYRQCPKRLWLEIHGSKPTDPDAQTQSRFRSGHEVGEKAREIYDPRNNGVVFNSQDEGYDEVIARTAELIELPQPLFEAGGNYQGLLKEVEFTEEAFGREEEVKCWIAAAQVIARKRKEPETDTGDHCTDPYPCAFLDYCQRDAVAAEYPVDWLPGTGSKKFRDLIEADGIADMREAPDECLNPKQLRVKTHTLAGTVYFDEDSAAHPARCA